MTFEKTLTKTDWNKVRYVFLDRDGVINKKPDKGKWVRNIQEFQFIDGALSAIIELKKQGKTVIVVTNQRGIALGEMTLQDVEDVHRWLNNALRTSGRDNTIDDFFVCPHDISDYCECRKPKTGMIDAAQDKYPDIDTENSIVIGDGISDIEMANNAGMKSILITGIGMQGALNYWLKEAYKKSTLAFQTLLEAVDTLSGVRV